MGLGVAAPAGAAATIADSLNAMRVILPNEPVDAPDFTLDGLHGRPVRLRDLRGRVVFLSFWATWCVPCRQEMPAMERLYQAYRERGLTMVAVNYKESPAEVKTFMEELRLTFPAALDRKGAVTASFAVRSLPVTYLVDRDGKILWKALGERTWDGPPSRGYFDRILVAAGR
jgi:thiol-disulfide isomerase/thioredoxin